MEKKSYSIRYILLFSVGALTLVIGLLAIYELLRQVEKLENVHSLRNAAILSDQLFKTSETLAKERDITVSLMYGRDVDTAPPLRAKLEESREATDQAFEDIFHALSKYSYADLQKPREEMDAQLADIRRLRIKIDDSGKLSVERRAAANEFYKKVAAFSQNTQTLWTQFIKRFMHIDPIATQHLRFKHFLYVLTDRIAYQRSIMERRLVDNANPYSDVLFELLRGDGIINFTWDYSTALGEQSGLFPKILPQFNNVKNSYQTLSAMLENILHSDRHKIDMDQWLEASTRLMDSMVILKDSTYVASGDYVSTLEENAKYTIMLHVIVLFVGTVISAYSIYVINRRVIEPINTIVDALVDTMEGKAASSLAIYSGGDEIGQLSKVLGSYQRNVEDIRQAKRRLEASENRLQAVVDNALNGIISINRQGLIETFNPHCEQIFGYKAEEVIGKNIKILMPDPYHSEHDGYLRNYLATGEAHIIGTAGREVRAKRKDGSIFPIDLSVSSYMLEDGLHFSGIIRDITLKKEAEKAIQNYMIALERSNRELDDFAYIASHDLKEPLRGIHNHSRFLLEDNEKKLDDDSVKKLNRLIYLSQRMEQLVNDLLYFSRLGRQELAIQPTNINEVVHDIQGTLEMFLAERHARIRIPVALPTITCDKPRITELLRNLITNAVKYNDNPEKWVEIGFASQAKSLGDAVYSNVFYVKDNGRGIAPEFHEDIFRIFKRLQSSDGVAEEGTGVGLTFVKKIIERHGGKIWLESKPGEGTAFYFTLEGQNENRKAS